MTLRPSVPANYDGSGSAPGEMSATKAENLHFPLHRPKRSSSGLLVFALSQALLIIGGVAYGAYRVQSINRERLPPIPTMEPVKVLPLHDRPGMVSDAQLLAVLNKLQPRFRGPNPKINYIDHALRFWGIAAAFEDPDCLSGQEMRELLLDHRAFSKAWGPKTRPFLVPDTRGDSLAFRTQSGQATASHVDHTLAGLAEVGTPLDFPVIAPKEEVRLSAAFTQALHSFSLNQEEYEWSTLVFLFYLPHVRQWSTTEGQIVTWDRLAERIMRQRLNQGVCFGNHRLHTLVMLLRVDADFHLLSPAGRQQITAHLQDVSRRLKASQHADGYWDGAWSGDEWDGPVTRGEGPLGGQADRLLATGHILEWCALADAEILPPEATLVRASQWICREIEDLSASQVTAYYPFLTHAGRALALWRGRMPHEILRRPVPAEMERTDDRESKPANVPSIP